MSNWQNPNPQNYNTNGYQNQYPSYGTGNPYAENQYQNQYQTQKNSKNPLNHQYNKRNSHGPTAYGGNNYQQKNNPEYSNGYPQKAPRRKKSRNPRYQTNDDVRPLTERQHQQYQQYPQSR